MSSLHCQACKETIAGANGGIYVAFSLFCVFINEVKGYEHANKSNRFLEATL